jgi:hypothetical protein
MRRFIFSTMNNAAVNLLRSLDSCGVQSVRFKILGLRRTLRHTSPVTIPANVAASFALSVTDVFTAYAIAPRQGAYELNVENGCLAFTPPAPRAEVKRSRLTLLKKRRAKSKSASRRLRATFAPTPHEIAA